MRLFVEQTPCCECSFARCPVRAAQSPGRWASTSGVSTVIEESAKVPNGNSKLTGILRSRHLNDWFILTDTASAMTPAISMSKFSVRSKWIRFFASGRNSARAMAPSDERSVSLRNRRLRFELSVKAVRSVVICPKRRQLVSRHIWCAQG